MKISTKPLLALVLIGILAFQPFLLSFAPAAQADEAPAVEAESAASSTPAVPDASGVTDTLDIPDTPDIPDVELTGTTTEATSTSSTQTASSTPDIPDVPDASSTPATPDASSTPATSAASTPPATQTATTTTQTATSTGPNIESGQAVALANILNIVNTNLVNSSGSALLLNYVDPVTGTIDLRNASSTSGASESAACALFACAGTNGVSVNLGSEGNIQNAVVLNATSGGNDIANAGDASITTGNAYAGLNLINLANTNIVDSNYLLMTMNAFQGVNGDIVFPSLTNFLSSLAHNLSPGTITNTSTASVSNNVNADAESGGNETSNTASSTIQTGGSASTGSVFNQINTDMLGGATVSILFRVQGDWAGQIFGAPDGLEWAQGPDGTIALTNSVADSGQGGSQSMANISASSSANIANDVSVVALTGENKIENAASALITTGTARASANVLNVANTNVVGKNWIMAIINIFGDFTGDIAFGRPDLWVGEQATVPSNLGNGSTVTYTYTVINNGDSPATDVTLGDEYDQQHVQIQSSSADYTLDATGNPVWNLGTIPAGGAVEVTYKGTIQNTSPGTDITDVATAHEHETDANDADNTDTATITMPSPSHGGGSHHGSGDDDGTNANTENDSQANGNAAAAAHLSITRAEDSHTTDGSAPVHEVLTVVNDSGEASAPVIVHDILYAPDGSALHDESWDVGSLAAGDGVQLAYDASFAADAPAGTYELSTLVFDEDGHALGSFTHNGNIILVPTTQAATGSVLGAQYVAPEDSGTVAGSESFLDAVLPTVPVAHAAENGNQAAAAGLFTFSWPFLLGILFLLFALLLLTAWYRRREER